MAQVIANNTETKQTRGHDRTQALKALCAGRSVVYACRLLDGTIKIGCSRSVWNRRRSWPDAELIGFMFGDTDDEKAVHASLRAHVFRGVEYYHPTPEVMAVVNAMRDEFNLPHVAA